MLQGWLPPLYALLGSLMAFGQITVFGYWMNSYWGGAVAAMGGCLLLGALPRLVRRKSALNSAAAASGLAVLAISRPFEGSLLAVTAGAAFVWLSRRRGRSLRHLLSLRVLLPFAAIGGLGVLWLCFYNYRNTGSAWLMPYVAYQRTYGMANIFVFLPDSPKPVYRHAIIEHFWRGEAERLQSRRFLVMRRLYRLLELMRFWCSELMVWVALAGGFLDRGWAAPLSLAILAAFGVGIQASAYMFAHYAAGAAGLLPVAAGSGLRSIRRRMGRFGPVLALLCVALAWGQLAEDGPACVLASATRSPRTVVAGLVRAHGGRHLILVKYREEHNLTHEYVFNAADIDRSDIVWARDMGPEKNRELLEYYRGRKVWLWQPDIGVEAIAPYPNEAVAGQAVR
jgi:hypothetical protein